MQPSSSVGLCCGVVWCAVCVYVCVLCVCVYVYVCGCVCEQRSSLCCFSTACSIVARLCRMELHTAGLDTAYSAPRLLSRHTATQSGSPPTELTKCAQSQLRRTQLYKSTYGPPPIVANDTNAHNRTHRTQPATTRRDHRPASHNSSSSTAAAAQASQHSGHGTTRWTDRCTARGLQHSTETTHATTTALTHHRTQRTAHSTRRATQYNAHCLPFTHPHSHSAHSLTRRSSWPVRD